VGKCLVRSSTSFVGIEAAFVAVSLPVDNKDQKTLTSCNQDSWDWVRQQHTEPYCDS